MAYRNDDPLNVATIDGVPFPLRDFYRNAAAAFLVCGGPSLNAMPLEKLRERGIYSLGVNNAAGHAPCSAMVYSDPPMKFHHGIHLDPKMMKFVPLPKLADKSGRNMIRAKLPDGTFQTTVLRARDCPGTVGFERSTEFEPEQFFTSTGAMWGNGKTAAENNGRERTYCTMLIGIRLLHYLGFRRVYLLGVDFGMAYDPGKFTAGVHDNYAFAQARPEDACRSNNEQYRVANLMLKELRPICDRIGFQVFNCNRQSRCTAFDHVPFDQAFRDCKGGVPDEPFDLSGWYEKS